MRLAIGELRLAVFPRGSSWKVVEWPRRHVESYSLNEELAGQLKFTREEKGPNWVIYQIERSRITEDGRRESIGCGHYYKYTRIWTCFSFSPRFPMYLLISLIFYLDSVYKASYFSCYISS